MYIMKDVSSPTCTCYVHISLVFDLCSIIILAPYFVYNNSTNQTSLDVNVRSCGCFLHLHPQG